MRKECPESPSVRVRFPFRQKFRVLFALFLFRFRFARFFFQTLQPPEQGEAFALRASDMASDVPQSVKRVRLHFNLRKSARNSFQKTRSPVADAGLRRQSPRFLLLRRRLPCFPGAVFGRFHHHNVMGFQIHGGQDGLSLPEYLIGGNVPHRIERDAPVERFRFLRTFPQNPSNGAFGDMMSHNPVKKFRDSFYRRPAITRQRRHTAPDKFRRNQNYAQYPFPRRKKGVQQRKCRLFQFRIVRPAHSI